MFYFPETCVCFQDFGTDLCLLNLTLGPLIEELADEGICDVSTGNECDFILIVGNGFVDTAKCKLAVYVVCFYQFLIQPTPLITRLV
jgi:hypothetical protein